MHKSPEYYMTTEEFASLIIESLEEQMYLNRKQRYHPEDIAAAFSSATDSVAKGASFIIGRIHSMKLNNDYSTI